MQLIQRERKIKGKGGCLEMERESCLSHSRCPGPGRCRTGPQEVPPQGCFQRLSVVARTTRQPAMCGGTTWRGGRDGVRTSIDANQGIQTAGSSGRSKLFRRNVGTWNRSSKGFFGVAEEVHTSRWSENKRKSEPGRKVSVERNRGRGQMKKTLTTQSTLENRKPRRTNR